MQLGRMGRDQLIRQHWYYCVEAIPVIYLSLGANISWYIFSRVNSN